MSGVAALVAGGTRSILGALQDAAVGTSDAIGKGATTAWNTVRNGTGKAVEGAGSVVGAGASAAGNALKGAGSAVGAGAAGAAGAAANAAAAASCAAQQARNLWCQTTGLCQTQEVVCQ